MQLIPSNRLDRDMGGHILVIDQGTTSTRAIVFDERARPLASAQMEFPQIYPRPGWIEHDPEDLWNTTLSTAREAIAKAGGPQSIAGIGVTNQRETTILWERKTGKPIHNAIVWQDRRTADRCAELARVGHTALIRERAGLVLDPYFSASKIAWILDHVAGARERAARGELAFGTVDTFLLWRLTGGAVHATDATNASRTSLLDIHTGRWDETLIELFDAPRSVLPEVRDTAGLFGKTLVEHLGAALPVYAMAGDQQSALVGQVCLSPGMAKATYGTGGFILLNTGATPIRSQHGLLTTIAYQLDGARDYALEGSIFSAGATVQWLRDGLGIIENAAEASALAASSDLEQEVYLVPAFTWLGAPHWRADARCSVMGLTRGATRKEIARAALESVGFQTDDLLAVMTKDFAACGATGSQSIIRVDGGMVASDWTMQFIADIVGAPVDRPTFRETTALGAAFLAGWRAGLYPAPGELTEHWGLDRRFTPMMSSQTREHRRAGWRAAVGATLYRREPQQ
jgi:glycerol kinase